MLHESVKRRLTWKLEREVQSSQHNDEEQIPPKYYGDEAESACSDLASKRSIRISKSSLEV